MKLPFCTTLGFLTDVECTVDADLEWHQGRPVVSVNDIIMNGHSLYRSEDYRMRELAGWIQDEVEKDAGIRNALLEDARENA